MADIQPPVENRLNYVPGTDVGVPGGIDRFQPGGADDRTNVFDILDYGGVGDGTTNNRTAFTNLIDAATGGVAYLPAGTWYIGGGGLNLQRFDRQLTLRGAGKGVTTLLLSGNLLFGASTNWADTYYERAITAGLEKGSTVLTVTGSTADYQVGNIVRITVGNRTTAGNRVIASNGGDNLQSVTNRITAKTSSTLTLLHPLADDLSGRSSAKIVRTNYDVGQQPTLMGFEHLTIDSNSAANAMVEIITCYGFWFKDVRFRRPANYSLSLLDCLNVEVRRCEFLEGTNGSSNHAHLLLNNSANCLFVDSFLDHSFPLIEKNTGSTGNAFVDLGLRDSGGASYLTHGPHDTHNLWEGCAVPLWQSDGYFGSESHMNLFRNWFYGQWTIGGAFSVGQTFNRFCRKAWQAANIFGTPGEDNGVQAFGNPNIGNGNSTGGIVSELATKATLTTRTSASVGTITGPSGHTVTTGQTITIAWCNFDSTVLTTVDRIVYKRLKVLVGAVSGTSIPISAGGGDDLPSASSEVWIPNTNAALRFPWSVVSGDLDAGGSGIAEYQPQDLDTLFSATLVANRYVDGSGNGAIAGGQELEGGETIPSSMVYSSKPNYFGDLAWPAFDALTPGTVNILRNPAAYRYINGTEVPGYDGGSGGGGLPASNPIRSARFPQRALIRAL